MFVICNPNPEGNRVGDCVIRAISIATNSSWESVYIDLALQGFVMKDMPSSNHVWGSYLLNKGFTRKTIPDYCPDCYTVREFCEDNPDGTYILGTGTHVIAVINGDHYDTWNSADEVPILFYRKE